MELAKGIFTIPGFLSHQECDDFVSLSERVGYGAATLATTQGPKLQREIRNNDRVIVDSPAEAMRFMATNPAPPAARP